MMAKLYTSDFWRTVTADTTSPDAAAASNFSDVDFILTLFLLTDWKNLEGSRSRSNSGELNGWEKLKILDTLQLYPVIHLSVRH